MRHLAFLWLTVALEAGCQPPTTAPDAAEDRRITNEVRRAVAGVPGASAQVQVVTHGGIVQLLGPVESGQAKALIGALAENVRGVLRIDNQLAIQPVR